MKKFIAVILSAMCFLSLTACDNDKTVSKEKDESEKTISKELITYISSDSVLENNSDNSASEKNESTIRLFDATKYNGEWATSGFDWEKDGFHLSLSVKGTMININCSQVYSSKVAETTIIANPPMVKENLLTTGFGDSFGNSGIMEIKFEDEKIVCTVSEVQYSDEGSGYSIAEGEYILTRYNEKEQLTVKGEYDDIAGSYVDAYGPGTYYLHIGYNDETKTKAFVTVDLNDDDFEIPLDSRTGDEISGLLMSSGSEPKYSISIVVADSGWIDANIYIGETGDSQEITFKPINANEAESKNPHYVG